MKQRLTTCDHDTHLLVWRPGPWEVFKWENVEDPQLKQMPVTWFWCYLVSFSVKKWKDIKHFMISTKIDIVLASTVKSQQTAFSEDDYYQEVETMSLWRLGQHGLSWAPNHAMWSWSLWQVLLPQKQERTRASFAILQNIGLNAQKCVSRVHMWSYKCSLGCGECAAVLTNS